jgi:hypothetical protein
VGGGAAGGSTATISLAALGTPIRDSFRFSKQFQKWSSPNFAVKLSEKGFEQRSEGGFGRYIGAETGRIVALRCPGRPRLTHLRDFSDSFVTAFCEVRGSKKLGKVR